MRWNNELWWLLLDLSALCVAWIVIWNMKCMHHGVNGVGGIDGDGINNNNTSFVNLHITIAAFRLTMLCATLHVLYPHHKYMLSSLFSLHLNHQFARGIKWGNGSEYAWLSCLVVAVIVVVAAALCDYHKVVVFIFCPVLHSFAQPLVDCYQHTHTCAFIHLGIVHFYLLSVSSFRSL